MFRDSLPASLNRGLLLESCRVHPFLGHFWYQAEQTLDILASAASREAVPACRTGFTREHSVGISGLEVGIS